MKNYILLFLLMVGWMNMSYAQDQQQMIEVTGTVTEENKEPLIGVNIVVKNVPSLGVMTDVNGHFKIKVPAYS